MEENKELAPLDEEKEEKQEYVLNITGGGKNREIRLSEGLFKFGVASLVIGLIIFIGACGYSIYSALNIQRNAAVVREIQQAEELQQEQLLAISKKAAMLSEAVQNLTQQEQELRIQAGLKPLKEEQPVESTPTEESTPDNETVQTENPTQVEKAPSVAEFSRINHEPTNKVTPTEPVAQVESSVPVETPAQLENVQAENPVPVKTSPSVAEFSRINHEQNKVTPAEPTAQIDSPSVSDFSQVEHNGQGGPINTLNIDDVSEALAMLEERINIRKESLDAFQAELKLQREQLAAAANSSSSAGASGDFTVPSFEGVTLAPGALSSYDISQFGGSPSADSRMPSIWPATGVVTSPYGLRWGGSDFHPGMDIANDLGTPIVATADGIVDYAGWNAGGYGNMVDIDHGNGIMTRYGHASQVLVTTGQFVKRGQVIALMGSTGFSTGPHVHYEVIINGQRVNPISYL